MIDPVHARADGVARLAESTFAAVEGLRAVAEQESTLAATCASVAAAVRPVLAAPGSDPVPNERHSRSIELNESAVR